MDDASIINARSQRLVACLDDYVNGSIDMETVELLIDAEETNANIPSKDFFNSVRELAKKIRA